MSEQVYDGYTVRIIRQNGRVRKVAQRGFEEYLDNELQAIEALKLLGIPSSMVLSVGAVVDTVDSQKGISMPDFCSAGIKTFFDYLCSQEGVPLSSVRNKDKDKELFFQLSRALSQNSSSLTDEKITSRLSIFLQAMDISDTYIAHLSQNDLSPSNIAVQETSTATQASLFDLNNAVTYDRGTVRPFVQLSKPRPGYPILGGIPIAETWSHPEVASNLESLLSSPNPETIFAKNEVYQATNVLYWSLTGKRLQESDAPLASQIPAKYRSLAEKVDALIDEVRKPIENIDLARVQSYRAEITTALDAYKASIPKPAAVATFPKGGFVLPVNGQSPTVIKPYTPVGTSKLGTIVETVKQSVGEYVSQAKTLGEQLSAANTELDELSSSRKAADEALLLQRVYTSFWRSAAIISTVAGLSLAAFSGVILYTFGKYSVPSCPSSQEVCAESLNAAQGYKEILDAHCPSTTDYVACLDALATPPTSEKCPVSLSQYNLAVLEKNKFKTNFETAEGQRQACELTLRNLQRTYRRLSSAQAQNDCPDEYTYAYEHIGIYQSAAETCRKKNEQCETEKATAEADGTRLKSAIETAFPSQKETIEATAIVLGLSAAKQRGQPRTEFCTFMKRKYIPIMGVLEDARVSSPLVDLGTFNVGQKDGMNLYGLYESICPQ